MTHGSANEFALNKDNSGIPTPGTSTFTQSDHSSVHRGEYVVYMFLKLAYLRGANTQQ